MDEREHTAYLQDLATKVDGLIVPPDNLAHFRRRVSEFIAAAEVTHVAINKPSEDAKRDPRLLDFKAGPPADGWVWRDFGITPGERGYWELPPKKEPLDLFDCLRPAGPLSGVLDSPRAPEEARLLCHYALLAIIHDRPGEKDNPTGLRIGEGLFEQWPEYVPDIWTQWCNWSPERCNWSPAGEHRFGDANRARLEDALRWVEADLSTAALPRLTVGQHVHLRDVLAVLLPGHPEESGYGRRADAFKLALSLLEQEWQGAFRVAELTECLAAEHINAWLRQHQGGLPAPGGDKYAEIAAQVRRIHRAGITPRILATVCTEYPDVAKATGLDCAQASPVTQGGAPTEKGPKGSGNTGAKEKRKKRGAKPSRDAKRDKRVYEARQKGLSYAEIAREVLGDESDTREVAKAIDSHRQKLKRMGRT